MATRYEIRRASDAVLLSAVRAASVEEAADIAVASEDVRRLCLARAGVSLRAERLTGAPGEPGRFRVVVGERVLERVVVAPALQSPASSAQLAADYNAGLERGRAHRERGGHPVPRRVAELPAARRTSYCAGWTKGYDCVTDLARLRRA